MDAKGLTLTMQISKMTMSRLPCPPAAATAQSSVSSSAFLPFTRMRSPLSPCPWGPPIGDATLPNDGPVPLLKPPELLGPRPVGLRNGLGEAFREEAPSVFQVSESFFCSEDRIRKGGSRLGGGGGGRLSEPPSSGLSLTEARSMEGT